MRQIPMRLIALAALAGPTAGAAWGDTAENCTTAWGNMPPADRGEMTLSDWTSKCLKSDYVVGVTGGAPDGATALCKDLNYSMRRNPKLRCSHHHGVIRMLPGAPKN